MPRTYNQKQRIVAERGDAPSGDASSSSSSPPPPDTAPAVDNHGHRKSTINALLQNIFSPSADSSRRLLDALISEGHGDEDIFDLADGIATCARTLHTLRLYENAKERHSEPNPPPVST